MDFLKSIAHAKIGTVRHVAALTDNVIKGEREIQARLKGILLQEGAACTQRNGIGRVRHAIAHRLLMAVVGGKIEPPAANAKVISKTSC